MLSWGALSWPPDSSMRGVRLRLGATEDTVFLTSEPFKARTASLCSHNFESPFKCTHLMGSFSRSASFTQRDRVSLSAFVLSARIVSSQQRSSETFTAMNSPTATDLPLTRSSSAIFMHFSRCAISHFLHGRKIYRLVHTDFRISWFTLS